MLKSNCKRYRSHAHIFHCEHTEQLGRHMQLFPKHTEYGITNSRKQISMSISSVIPFFMERFFFLFLTTVGFCTNTYLVNMYDHICFNEKSRIHAKLLCFDGYIR